VEGNLQIGDEWKAITIIARSQPNPLKAVAELVENAIDARADRVLIVRDKDKGVGYVAVYDNGEGLRLDEKGEPDFRYVATHICDSLKRGLPALERRAVQGEFGIGLLGFWNLGRELRMVALNAEGRPREMVMREGEPSFTLRVPEQAELTIPEGVEVRVSHLHPTTKHLLTGEKLQRFLAMELRDRIRQQKVRVEIRDRIARKELIVTPHAFPGERVARIQRIPIPGFGAAHAELYLNLDADPREHRVGVARNGTRIVEDIRLLPGCDRSPWNRGVFAGMIDFPGLSPAPGSRQGIIQDAAYTAFAQEIQPVAEALEDLLDRRSQSSTAVRTREVAREVRKRLASAINTLPEEEYPHFDTGRERTRAEPLVEAAEALERAASLDAGQPPESVGGALDAARAEPAHAWIPVGQARGIRIVAVDEQGRPAAGDLTYAWRVTEGPGVIERQSGERAWVRGKEPGRLRLVAEVSGEEVTVSVAISATVASSSGPTAKDRERLPFYELVADPEHEWRSRFEADRNAIVINSGHPDYEWSQGAAHRQKHYLAMLYCKELVLRNFPDAEPEVLLERFAQLAGRIAGK
jgi:hypothetical protein